MRNHYFDNAKVILIFLVVLGHFIEINKGVLGEHVYWLIYSFHMPTFIFIAGYFSKKEAWGVTFKKVIGLFILPYIIFQVLYNYLNFIWFGNQNFEELVNANYALWFLLSMAFWKIAIQIVIRFKWTIMIFVALFITHRFWIDDLNFLSIGRSISFSLFFFMGYFAKNNIHLLEKIKTTKIINKIIGVVGFIVIIMLYKYDVVTIPVDWFKGKYFSEALLEVHSIWYLMGYQIYVFLFSSLIVIFFMLLVPTSEYAWTRLGSCTLSVYLLHVTIHHYMIKEGYGFAYDTVGHLLTGSALALVVVYILSQPIFNRFVDYLSHFLHHTKNKS